MVKPNGSTNGQKIVGVRRVSFSDQVITAAGGSGRSQEPLVRPDALMPAGRKSSFVITSVRDKNGFDSDDSDDDHSVRTKNVVQNVRPLPEAVQPRCNGTAKAPPAGILKSNSSGAVNGCSKPQNGYYRNDYSPGLTAVIEQAKVTEIGGKIDKAMDLAKVHLLYTVRSEIKQLKEHIEELDCEMKRLRLENQYLRRHVPLIVLTHLKNVTNVNGVAKVMPTP